MENIDSIIKECVFIRTENHVCTMKVLQPIHNTYYMNLSSHFTMKLYSMKACMVQSIHVICSETKLQESYVISCLSTFIYTLIDYLFEFNFQSLCKEKCFTTASVSQLSTTLYPMHQELTVEIAGLAFDFYMQHRFQWHFYLLSRSPIFQLVNLVSDI